MVTKVSKIFLRKGGGSAKKPRGFEGGWPKTHVCLQWGEGGSKKPNFLSTWFVEAPLGNSYFDLNRPFW